MRKCGLPPIADSGCRLLILGSMPGEASLQAQRYYGHPRNQFWPLLYRLLEGGEPAAAYEDRVGFALSRGVALWDVLTACEREGSLDSAIRKPEAGDFGAFYASYPGIRYVFFNGRASAELYRQHVLPSLPPREGEGRGYVVLPSSSPAYTLSMEEKLKAWQPVREAWRSTQD